MEREILNILQDKKIITIEDIYKAEDVQKDMQCSITKALVHLKIISPEEVANTIAEYYGLEFVDNLQKIKPLASFPTEIVYKYKVFPVGLKDEILHLVVEDPTNIEITDAVSRTTGYNVLPVVATAREIDMAIHKWYKNDIMGNTNTETEDNSKAIEILNAPAVKIVQNMIEAALSENISDIHIEPLQDKTNIRFRHDGTLKIYQIYQKYYHPSIVSRIKVMAGLNITERRLPQDGRIKISNPRPVDLRVSVVPTIYGEKIAIRLFDKMQVVTRLDSLGFDNQGINILKRAASAPFGMILVTGPTGSGKTTTLYAVLSEIVSEKVNVVTIEDPPEYNIQGVNHIAINTKIGFGFATALKAILRQDPDVVMIGEIRDSETARVAVQAALTGHLVLSTLHTNNAISAPIRLVDMGVEPYLVASALICVVSQRLVRVLCPKCKENYLLEQNIPALSLTEGASAFRAVGCQHCSYTGYQGRTAVVELLPINQTVRSLIRANADSDKLGQIIKKEGVVLLSDKVHDKLIAGKITIEDAIKNTFTGEI